jgi:hypothetical protein
MKVQASNPQQMKAVGLVFVLVGMGMLALAGFFTVGTLRFLDPSVRVQGTITALLPVPRSSNDQNSGNTQITYAPQFSFADASGKTVTVTSRNSSNPPEFEVGESVFILYVPGDPEEARIDSFWQLWALPVILGSVGTSFLCVVLVMALGLRARSRRSLPSLSSP